MEELEGIGLEELLKMFKTKLGHTDTTMSIVQTPGTQPTPRSSGIGASAVTGSTLVDAIPGNSNSSQDLVRRSVEKALGAIPNPITQGISIASSLGRAVDKVSKNDEGIYKSKFSAVADSILDPVGKTTEIIGDVFSGKMSASNYLNYMTFGLAGKNRRQEEAKEQSRIKSNNVVNQSIADSTVSSQTPKYKAPLYGTKFS